MKNKIQLNDNSTAILTKMSEGNIGALSVLINLMKEEGSIDPDSALAGIGTILDMDTMGIYGSHIWILYKDICKQDLKKLVAIFRGHQLGLVREEAILAAAFESKYSSLDPDDILEKVKEKLPEFAKTI